MVMTISAYTEPVQTSIAVSELPQPDEDEEAGESSGFAEILASLMQNTEKIQIDISSVDFSGSDINIDAFSSDELTGRQEKLNSFESSEQIMMPAGNEISGSEIPEEYLSAQASVENLLNSAAKTDVDTGHFQSEIDIVKKADLQEAATDNNFLTADFSDAAASNEFIEELLSQAEAQYKSALSEKMAKDRALSKNENAEALLNMQRSDFLKKPESETRGRLDEMRGRSRRDKVSFEVRDLRTETETNTQKTQRPFSVLEAAAKRSNGEAPAREITLELRLPDGHNGSALTQGQTIWETKSGNNGSVSTAMENLLARELHQNFNGDIVRHASMALRDGGEGTIRIALRPESLGNVKIHLEMTENKITGQIVVESKEALNAFRKEIASLEEAFRDSGFTNADLNLSLTSEGQNKQDWEQDAGSFTPLMAASRYDDSSFYGDGHDMLLADVLIGQKTGLINVLA